MLKDPRDKIVDILNDLSTTLGIEPLYLATFITLLILLSYKKELKKWDELPKWRKLLISITVIGFLIFFTLSTLIFLEIIVTQ